MTVLPPSLACSFGSSGSSGTGAGDTMYVVDSGIKLSHQEFKSADGGASRASYGQHPPMLRMLCSVPWA